MWYLLPIIITLKKLINPKPGLLWHACNLDKWRYFSAVSWTIYCSCVLYSSQYKFLKIYYFYFIHVSAGLHTYMCTTCMSGAHRGQKRALAPLELRYGCLWALWFTMSLLGTKLGSLARAANTLNNNKTTTTTTTFYWFFVNLISCIPIPLNSYPFVPLCVEAVTHDSVCPLSILLYSQTFIASKKPGFG